MRIVNRTEFATRADVVVVGGHDDLDFEELRIASQAVGRGAELIGATRDATFPMPDGPWPGTGAVLAAIETAAGPQGRPRDRQAGAADVRGGARPPRRGPLPRRSATGSTSTSRARATPGWTPRWCSPGSTSRAEANAADPRPRTSRTRSRRSCWDERSADGPRPLPDRQPHRRRRPRRAAAARRRGRAARARAALPRRAHDLDGARARAGARRRRGGRGGGGDGRRRAHRRRGRRAARRRRRARRAPRRPRQRLRAQARDHPRPGGGLRAHRRRRRAPDRPRRGRRRARYLGILSAGLDSDANAIANATKLKLGTGVYAYGALRALARWKPAPLDRARSTASRARFTGYSVAVANSGVYGSGMYLVPDASLDDGMLDVVLSRGHPQAALPGQRPEGLQGHPRRRARPALPARAAASPSTPTGRSPPTPTATRSPSCPPPSASSRARCACWRRDAARGRAGGRPRGRRAGARHRARRRDLAARQGAHAHGAARDRAARRPPAARERGDLRHQRQDDDRGDGLRRCSSAAGTRLVHNRAGANMVGGVASALAAAARRGGRSVDGDLGLFEVDEFWLAPVVEELEPRALLLSNLFRDQLDRYGELDTIADRWAELVARRGRPLPARAQRRRPAGRRPRAAPAGALYFGVEDASLALPGAPARLRLQALPPLRARLRLRDRLPRPPRPLPLPQLRPARAPSPQVVARDVELHGIRSAAFTLSPTGAERRVELPLPGLYNVYNALGAAALCLALRGARGRDRELARPRRARVRARRDDRPRRAPDLDPAGQEPRRAPTRSCARSRSRARELDVFGVLNDRTADGRDVSWVWDADWEVLAPRVRRMTCSGTRAAELALRMKYAGVDPERLHVVEGLEAGLDAALADARQARSTRCPPTRRCWSCASCSPAAARRRSTGDERLRQGRLARRGVRRLRRRPDAVAASSPARRAARCSTSAPGTGRVALRARRPPATTSPRSTATASCWRCWPSRAAGGGLRVETVLEDAADFALPRRFALIAVPMQTLQLLPDEAARGPGSSRARRPRCSPAASWRSRSPTRWRPSTSTPLLPRPDLGERDGLRYVSQPVAVRERPGARADRARPPDRRPRRRTAPARTT